MAHFNYDILFDGKRIDEGLSSRVVEAIEGVKAELNLTDYPHASFVKSYRTQGETNRVILRVAGSPAKLEGTEGAHLQFAGSEEDILRTKSDLLTKLPKLTLI